MARNLNEIKSSLNSQIQDAVTTAVAEKVLTTIQNILDMQGRGNFTVVDRSSSCLQRSPGAAKSQKTWENHPNRAFVGKIKENRIATLTAPNA